MVSKMHLPEIDKYAGLNSPFHSWDPRVKTVSLGVLILAILFVNNIKLALGGLLLSLGLVLLSRIPFFFVFTHLRWVLLFCLFLLVIMPLTVEGDKLWSIGPLVFSYNGFKHALLITLRAVGIVLLIFPMFGTSRFYQSLKALQTIGVPERIVQMMMFTYRYIFVLVDELHRMMVSAYSRGFRNKGNIYTLKIVGNLVGMLFVRSFERTQRIYNAMISRGYKGHLSTIEEFKICKADFFKASVILGLAVGIIVARWIV